MLRFIVMFVSLADCPAWNFSVGVKNFLRDYPVIVRLLGVVPAVIGWTGFPFDRKELIMKMWMVRDTKFENDGCEVMFHIIKPSFQEGQWFVGNIDGIEDFEIYPLGIEAAVFRKLTGLSLPRKGSCKQVDVKLSIKVN